MRFLTPRLFTLPLVVQEPTLNLVFPWLTFSHGHRFGRIVGSRLVHTAGNLVVFLCACINQCENSVYAAVSHQWSDCRGRYLTLP